jgi:hypothetical protein
VMEDDEGYLKDKLPASYLSSPMLIVKDWRDAVGTMKALAADKKQLDARQAALVAWYDAYMRGKMKQIEAIVRQKEDRSGTVCTL